MLTKNLHYVMQLLFVSQIVMVGNVFHSMKSNFFSPDIVGVLNTKHLILKQILASMLVWENK